MKEQKNILPEDSDNLYFLHFIKINGETINEKN